MRKTFRMDCEVMHDPGAYVLSDRAFRLWIYLRCAVVYYGGCFPADDLLAKYCRFKPRKFSLVIKELLDGKYVERGPDGILALVPSYYENDRPNAADWAELRSKVFARDDFTCAYCGGRGGKLECDHVHPVSRGGSNSLDNLKTACFSCNRSKRDKTLDEWKRVNGSHPYN